LFSLYLVDTMAKEYGGDVSVTDNDPKGAVFVVTLPVAAPADEPE
jgi:signal transduction histidine kinase